MDMCQQLLEALRVASNQCSLSQQLLQPLVAVHTDLLEALVQAGQVQSICKLCPSQSTSLMYIDVHVQDSDATRDAALLLESTLQLLSRCCLLGSLEAFFTADDLVSHFQEAVTAAVRTQNVCFHSTHDACLRKQHCRPCLHLADQLLCCRVTLESRRAPHPTSLPSLCCQLGRQRPWHSFVS